LGQDCLPLNHEHIRGGNGAILFDATTGSDHPRLELGLEIE
jgi:hypothetical protein